MSSPLKALLAVVLACGTLSACETRTETAEQGATTETAPAPDVESVRAEIQSVNDRWETAAMAGDVAALTDLYTEDAMLLVPDQPLASGRGEIQAGFESMFGGFTYESISIDTEHVEVSESGDMAWAVGSFSDAGSTTDGTPFTTEGKYVSILENVDGEWKIAVDAWNTNGDTPAGAPTEDTPSE